MTPFSQVIQTQIARRIGYGKKIVVGDKSYENASTIAQIMNDAGYDVEPVEIDLTDQEAIFIKICLKMCGRKTRNSG